MIHISNFDQDFNKRKFKDRSTGIGSDLTVIGYGDNQGNPYLIGIYSENNQVGLKTVLLKNVEFIP
jgi:hypothetical protein